MVTRILFFKALWGMSEGATLRDKFHAAKEAGFDGIEAAIESWNPDEVKSLCAEFELKFISQIFPETPEAMEQGIRLSMKAGAGKIVSHTGRDKWSFERGCELFRTALELEQKHGVVIAHETHRRRMLYSPWSTARYLEEFPDLRLTLDLSHWCVVCESLLDDVPDLVDLAQHHAIHLHARVGYEEGPQVPDPSAPEYRRHLEAHERWWDALKSKRESDGTRELTITPEFGPPNYLHTLPHTNQPVADLWKVNLWMRDRLRDRWRLP
ncbi:TIM barrel protein [Candidatus Sumerlaeota bacterium]|nr:TIM barrel protein [Candidatus Sumerlaeota bacterium]